MTRPRSVTLGLSATLAVTTVKSTPTDTCGEERAARTRHETTLPQALPTYILSTGDGGIEAADSGGGGDARVKANLGGVAEPRWC